MKRSLHWFPKQFSPGDMDASGGEQLLGKTELSRLDVLVRETAQNSWDARLQNAQPAYGITLRRLQTESKRALSALLNDAPEDIRQALTTSENFNVLEIYDRGTTGLDGPIDFSPVGSDQPSRYQDLILKFGISHNDGLSGGTYGFGKTATFAFSRIGTVVYWSRCRNPEGNVDDRFIITAYGRSYHSDGIQYTGRHWWGVEGDESTSILPVTGHLAYQLGSRLFKRTFQGEETGTSILVLQPRIEEVSANSLEPADSQTNVESEELIFMRHLASSVRANLWTKTVALNSHTPAPMNLSIEYEGHEYPLRSPAGDALDYWAAGLNAIREYRINGTQRTTTKSEIPVKVVEVKRYKKVIGHLALVRRITQLEHWLSHDDMDPAKTSSKIHRISLMRGRTELVVTTVDWIDRIPFNGLEWLAVFKASDEFDKYYAQAEPPAHDRWTTGGSNLESAKIVKHTRNRIKRIITEEFYPDSSSFRDDNYSPTVSTGNLSRRLSKLLPDVMQGPTVPTSRGWHSSATRPLHNRNRWRIETTGPRLVKTDTSGFQKQKIIFTATGPDETCRLIINSSIIGEDGHRERIPIRNLQLEWSGSNRPIGRETLIIKSGLEYCVQLSGPPRRAMRIELIAENIYGDN